MVESDNGEDSVRVAESKLTRTKYAAAVGLLRGKRIAGITYYVLMGGDDGREPEQWDFGTWHAATMGVELVADSGERFCAVWGDSFDHYGLELFTGPMTDHVVMLGEPGGVAAISVSRHPQWAGLVGTELTGVDVAWSDDPVSTPSRCGLAPGGHTRGSR
ncbi:hypothetical protein Athai_63610 [Actinocatenispora thailandica]|uniref:Uncharacterized protein n=1 Tax=Actinocatenispora thailandica TaxID=227318 RepID=A0A7R7I1A4_9ACTN|nr:hypothetical protein [Actinocatenispora thailandica]BCJ38858.1 hypothetical protein Athai_63610 [Actinocatenispora thailandica]